MTSYTTQFPRGSFIGFDHLLNELDHVAKHANDHYPPHNIIKTGDTDYLIELAVAGFPKDSLSIEVKDRTLTVIGNFDTNKREYIHRGISTKNFKRTFRLSEHVEVNGADFKDGILSISLEYRIPKELLPRRIEIGHYEENKNDTSHTSTAELLTESNL